MQLNLADLAIFRKQYWKVVCFILMFSIVVPIAPFIGMVVYLIGSIIAGLTGVCTGKCASGLINISTPLASFCLFVAMAATFMAIAYVMCRWERR